MAVFLAIIFLILASALNWTAFMWYTFGVWPLQWWPVLIFSIIGSVISLTVRHLMEGKD